MKAKESRRMTSIARRINRAQVSSLFFTLLIVNLFILLAAILGWAWVAEHQAYGDQWTYQLKRSLEWVDGQNLRQTLQTVVYVFSGADGIVHRVAAGDFLVLCERLATITVVFELIVLFFHWRGGRKRTMRLLTPLHQMSEAAEQLSSLRFDEQKYHDLEDAIAAISPSAPDARLSTGDSDLQGLETAVNNLLSRMHESYRQQIRFVSDASHELRTPISVIRGYADMLARWGKDDEKILGESIAAIRGEADNMQRLVEQLLFLARGEAGRNQPTLQPLDLSALMREVYEEYAMIEKEHRWQLRADAPVPSYGDAALLKQAVRVLCDNAIKYSAEGEQIVLRSFTDDRGIPCFSVQDSGAGIPAGDIPHIFERFYRADRARTRHTGGTGLGLSIAKWIVDQHKGYFQVISHEGLGTRMVVCLPVLSKEGQSQPSKESASAVDEQAVPVP